MLGTSVYAARIPPSHESPPSPKQSFRVLPACLMIADDQPASFRCPALVRPVAVPATRVTAARASSTSVSAGYVPDGLTAKQWEDMKKEKAKKAEARKKEVKSKKFEVRILPKYQVLLLL